ncbi:hypothetical protein G7Y79_00009g026930 [Physcia stellaris]|nr:hypothetical protein G7Y79_00009g026930 [Physcia stellaris]
MAGYGLIDLVLAQMTTLETLPLELKQEILHNVDDIKTLRGITHASPAYYKAYHTLRNELLTKVTLNLLRSRGFEICEPKAFLQVYVGHVTGKLRQKLQMRALHGAIKSVYDQVDLAKSNARGRTSIKLGYEQCLALRALVHVIAWDVRDGQAPKDGVWYSLFGPEGLCWESYTHGFLNYNLLAFGVYDDKEARRAMKGWINFRMDTSRNLFGGKERLF